MNQWAALACTVFIGVAIGLLFSKLKVPAGYMIGAFVGVTAFNVITSLAWAPPNTRTAVQVIAGAFVGCSMERSDVARLKHIGQPVLFMLASFLIFNIVLGFVLWAISSLDLVTALMCAVPGGINDTPIVAADMGANAPVVTVMQLIRQILGIALFPSMILAFDRYRTAQGHPDIRSKGAIASTDKRKKSKQKSWISIIVTLFVAALAGILGKMTGIPGMTFAFAIVAVLVLKLALDFAFIPKWVKLACQLIAGCYLGTLLTMQGLTDMKMLIVPIIVLIFGYTLNCFVMGKLESRFFGYGRKEGMLIASPAGASDMALIIDDMKVKNTDVVIMQVIRAVVVMTLFPQIINLICFAMGGT